MDCPSKNFSKKGFPDFGFHRNFTTNPFFRMWILSAEPQSRAPSLWRSWTIPRTCIGKGKCLKIWVGPHQKAMGSESFFWWIMMNNPSWFDFADSKMCFYCVQHVQSTASRKLLFGASPHDGNFGAFWGIPQFRTPSVTALKNPYNPYITVVNGVCTPATKVIYYFNGLISQFWQTPMCLSLLSHFESQYPINTSVLDHSVPTCSQAT